MTSKIALLKNALKRNRLDAIIITKDVNVAYLSDFKGHDAALFITRDRSTLITDSRYIEEAEDTVKGFDVCLSKGSLYESIREISSRTKLKRTGFEAHDLSYAVATRLKNFIGSSSLIPTEDFVENFRMVKDPSEIALIRKSIALAKSVLDRTLPFIRPGVTEEFVAEKIEVAFIEQGARPGFELIVAAGHNSSKPHARPSNKRIDKNNMVMLDIGCALNGYNSDITRMVLTGRISLKMREIYNVVSAARAMAIDAVRPGEQISKLDRIARGYISKKGFGKFFGHALGHGVGMEVHEKPSISGINKDTLTPGMVFTIEPAIYIPKVGGVRIEDMVLVTNKGYEVLSI